MAAAPDGYTLLATWHTHTISAAMNPKLSYHPVDSFTPITQFTSAGLMLVVLSSTVAELHGRETANRMVIVGFLPLVLAMALIGFVLALPAADDMDPVRLEAFQLVLSQGPRLMGAGILAYGISTLLNVRLFSALRDSGRKAVGGSDDTPRGGLWLMARGAVASALSQVVDTLIFITVAFYGVFPIGPLLVGQMIAKVALSLIVVPVVIQGAVMLGRKLDAGQL